MLFAAKSLDNKINRGAKLCPNYAWKFCICFLQSFPLRENKISTTYRLVQADLGNKLKKLNRSKIPFIFSVLFSSLIVKNCKCFLSLEKLPNEHLALPAIF